MLKLVDDTFTKPTKRVRRWRCTTCGTEGGFSFLVEAFATQVQDAQRKGHLQVKPACAAGRFETLP